MHDFLPCTHIYMQHMRCTNSVIHLNESNVVHVLLVYCPFKSVLLYSSVFLILETLRRVYSIHINFCSTDMFLVAYNKVHGL